MKRFMVMLIVLVLLADSVPVGAQDGGELQCDEVDIGSAATSIMLSLQMLEGMTPEEALNTLVGIQGDIAVLQSQCWGLDFEGVAGTLHGPMYLPEGLYRVSVATNDFFIMQGIRLSGECGNDYSDEFNVFNAFSSGDFTAEVALRSGGCEVLFETSNVFGPYTVTFEKLR